MKTRFIDLEKKNPKYTRQGLKCCTNVILNSFLLFAFAVVSGCNDCFI